MFVLGNLVTPSARTHFFYNQRIGTNIIQQWEIKHFVVVSCKDWVSQLSCIKNSPPILNIENQYNRYLHLQVWRRNNNRQFWMSSKNCALYLLFYILVFIDSIKGKEWTDFNDTMSNWLRKEEKTSWGWAVPSSDSSWLASWGYSQFCIFLTISSYLGHFPFNSSYIFQKFPKMSALLWKTYKC